MQQAKLTESPPVASSLFGFSSALSGDTAVVGAWLDDTEAGVNAGAAYVFVRSGSSWNEQAKLTASDGAPDDNFGFSVAILGDTVVIGAMEAQVNHAGAAYVFTRTGTAWTQQAKLSASDASANDAFGWSVALSGETAVIGAMSDYDPGAGGSAYVFVRNGAAWSQQAKLTASDASSADQFGWSVSIAGDTVVVGAEGEDQGGGTGAGAAYVFVRNGVAWSQEAKLLASDSAQHAYFGNAVAVSGDTAVVAAEGAAAGAVATAGAAYVFERTSGHWAQQAKFVHQAPATYIDFGSSVALQGDVAVVGCASDKNAGVPAAGSAHVFVRAGTTWNEQSTLFVTDPAPGSHVGQSVAIDGGTVVIGAGDDAPAGIAGAGSMYVFDLVTIGTWSDLGLPLAGTNGLPVLTSAGYQIGGLPVALSLDHAKPFSLAPLVVGIGLLAAPFKGGVMVPNPNFIFPAFSDFFGNAVFGGQWPLGVPSGFTTYFQWWIQDPAGPKGFAASNALAGTTP
jgi:hypothetical protein